MITKISYKLFAIHIGIIIILTLASIVLFSRSSHTMFSGAINGIDSEVMEHLSKKLSGHYREFQSWEKFTSSSGDWSATVNESFFTTFFALVEKAKKRSGENGAPNMAPPNSNAVPGDNWNFPFGTFIQRLSLLDAKKNFIIKAEILKSDLNYQAIRHNGNIIGWLSVGKINLDTLPLGEYFLKQQLDLIYLIMIFGGLVAAILSFLLSRQITLPIYQLTEGVKEIARRNYQNRLSIKTNDELQILAEGLNTAAHQLERLETQKKQWLLDISHELRTPLSILISETSAICDNITQCDIAAIEVLRQDLMQMKRLVDDLHDLSKVDEMGFSFHKEKLDFNNLVLEQLKYYEKVFVTRDIKLRIDADSNPLYITADSDRIVQAIRILLENCSRYSTSPGEVWVHCHNINKQIHFTVEDSGPGVPTESLDKLFDRLYRTDASRNRATGGAGLGLAICKEIVLAHNGEISATHSELGGTRITIVFTLGEHNLP